MTPLNNENTDNDRGRIGTLRKKKQRLRDWDKRWKRFSCPAAPRSHRHRATILKSWSSNQKGQMRHAQIRLWIFHHDERLLVALFANWFLRRQPKTRICPRLQFKQVPDAWLRYIRLYMYLVSHIKRHSVSCTRYCKKKKAL